MHPRKFSDEYDKLRRVYWKLIDRAELSFYTKSTRARRIGALRRLRVGIRGLREQCGCEGCKEALQIMSYR
jgi:hypothetical protein